MATADDRRLDPRTLRRHIVRMASAGNSVHLGCAFSVVEIMAVLYSRFLAAGPDVAGSPDRDYMILSKGHGVMAMYACFREIGRLPQEALDRYFSDGSLLHGLCEWTVPGCEVTTGSMGHGLPIAAGVALGLKRRGRTDRKVYCLVGDGEMNEGPMWEALLFAAHHQLDNLIVILDANGFQAMGPTSAVLNLEPLAAKFRGFGFETRECGGHDAAALEENIRALTENKSGTAPKALIARTVKGKGVSFMEGNNDWHYLRLDAETKARALSELGGADA
ncbi:MAG: transketolase [Elusimicrobia bacterium]|nr:transketolase [Elusimicrobiota bacterium]